MKKYLIPVQSFWSCLTSIGLQYTVEEKDKKNVKFTNVIAVLTAIAVFIYIPFSLLQHYYILALLQSIDVVCVLSVLGLNHWGYPRLSRQVYILVINSFVLINACFIGNVSGVQDFFYIAYIVPFLLFGVKDYRNIIIGVLTSILFFNIYQHIYPDYTHYNLDIATQYSIANINLWMKFILFGVAIYILSYYNYMSEGELEASNKKLQKQAEELRRSNDDLEQFAAIISHDLKAPVRNVSSFMTLLMRRHSATLDPDALNFIELSKNSTDRMGRQIDDLLSYSKLGRNLPKPASVDINNMIAAIKMELGEKIREKNALVITQQLLPTLRNVHSSMIHHVFQNLIANGIKFNTNDKPEVCITYAESPESYTFCVNDNGIGIDDHSKVKLFQMFKRLHSDSEFEGTGIGLAVCKKIVEFYGGTIWLESEKGKGTAFYFTLPRLNMGHAQIYNAKLPGITLSQFASAS